MWLLGMVILSVFSAIGSVLITSVFAGLLDFENFDTMYFLQAILISLVSFSIFYNRRKFNHLSRKIAQDQTNNTAKSGGKLGDD